MNMHTHPTPPSVDKQANAMKMLELRSRCVRELVLAMVGKNQTLRATLTRWCGAEILAKLNSDRLYNDSNIGQLRELLPVPVTDGFLQGSEDMFGQPMDGPHACRIHPFFTDGDYGVALRLKNLIDHSDLGDNPADVLVKTAGKDVLRDRHAAEAILAGEQPLPYLALVNTTTKLEKGGVDVDFYKLMGVVKPSSADVTHTSPPMLPALPDGEAEENASDETGGEPPVIALDTSPPTTSVPATDVAPVETMPEEPEEVPVLRQLAEHADANANRKPFGVRATALLGGLGKSANSFGKALVDAGLANSIQTGGNLLKGTSYWDDERMATLLAYLGVDAADLLADVTGKAPLRLPDRPAAPEVETPAPPETAVKKPEAAAPPAPPPPTPETAEAVKEDAGMATLLARANSTKGSFGLRASALLTARGLDPKDFGVALRKTGTTRSPAAGSHLLNGKWPWTAAYMQALLDMAGLSASAFSVETEKALDHADAVQAAEASEAPAPAAEPPAQPAAPAPEAAPIEAQMAALVKQLVDALPADGRRRKLGAAIAVLSGD